jgi:hypothetical protein
MDRPSISSSASEHLEVDDEKDIEGLETQQNHNAMPITKTRTAQDWDGPNDPEDPLNWPVWKKVYHTAMVGFLCFTM